MSALDKITTRLTRPSKPFTSRAGTSIRACCPACGGENRTKLIVTEKTGGGILIHCFAGCDPLSILNAIDLKFADLFGDGDVWRSKPLRPDARHDKGMLVGMAIEIVAEAEFLLMQHAACPTPGVGAKLLERAQELAQIKEFLKKENTK